MVTAATAVWKEVPSTEQQLRQRIDWLTSQRGKIESELKAASDSVERAKAKRAEAVAALLSSSPGSERSKIHSTVDALDTEIRNALRSREAAETAIARIVPEYESATAQLREIAQREEETKKAARLADQIAQMEKLQASFFEHFDAASVAMGELGMLAHQAFEEHGSAVSNTLGRLEDQTTSWKVNRNQTWRRAMPNFWRNFELTLYGMIPPDHK